MKPITTEDLPAVVRQRRKSLGLSVRAFCRLLSVSTDTVRRLEGGDLAVSLRTLRAITEALGLGIVIVEVQRAEDAIKEFVECIKAMGK